MYILFASLSITIALLMAASIYFYLIKYKENKNSYYHFMSQVTNKKKLCINNINQN